jgi:NAD(P)-dependent dehydrogenase (short-subunit alcohol dehydrogenase family)
MLLSGKVALVAGAGQGVGQSIGLDGGPACLG